MFLTELLKVSSLKEGDVGSDDIVIVPAGVRPGIDYNLVVNRSSFEDILVTYRTTEPASESILMALGSAKNKEDLVWNYFLSNELVVQHYSNLCSDFYAKKLSVIAQNVPTLEVSVVENTEDVEDVEDNESKYPVEVEVIHEDLVATDAEVQVSEEKEDVKEVATIAAFAEEKVEESTTDEVAVEAEASNIELAETSITLSEEVEAVEEVLNDMLDVDAVITETVEIESDELPEEVQESDLAPEVQEVKAELEAVKMGVIASLESIEDSKADTAVGVEEEELEEDSTLQGEPDFFDSLKSTIDIPTEDSIIPVESDESVLEFTELQESDMIAPPSTLLDVIMPPKSNIEDAHSEGTLEESRAESSVIEQEVSKEAVLAPEIETVDEAVSVLPESIEQVHEETTEAEEEIGDIVEAVSIMEDNVSADSGALTGEQAAAISQVYDILSEATTIFTTYGFDRICEAVGTTGNAVLNSIAEKSDGVRKVLQANTDKSVNDLCVIVLASLKVDIVDMIAKNHFEEVASVVQPIMKIIYEE